MPKNTKKIINLLEVKKITLAVAESCTGGMLAQEITSISGSSKVFKFGVITYSNNAKIKYRKVPSKIIKRDGAVSEECCYSMLKNLSKISKTNINIEYECAKKIDCTRIKDAISHTEFIVDEIKDDSKRPTIICKPVNEEMHNFYYGLNRAKSSVIELCILASRLGIIEDSKIKKEIKYLEIAIKKTAGEAEIEAWNCVLEYIKNYLNKKNR